MLQIVSNYNILFAQLTNVSLNSEREKKLIEEKHVSSQTQKSLKKDSTLS